jgi:hypothetical protein
MRINDQSQIDHLFQKGGFMGMGMGRGKRNFLILTLLSLIAAPQPASAIDLKWET